MNDELARFTFVYAARPAIGFVKHNFARKLLPPVPESNRYRIFWHSRIGVFRLSRDEKYTGSHSSIAARPALARETSAHDT